MRSQPWLKALATDDDDPDRNERFMTETDVDGVPVRVVELTGAAGTVYITHPWVLHSLAPNTRKTPRLMRSFPIRQNGTTTDASLSRTEYGSATHGTLCAQRSRGRPNWRHSNPVQEFS